MHAQEAVGGDAAFEECAKLPLHESRDDASPLADLREQSLEGLGDGGVQDPTVGLPREVAIR